MSYPVEKEVKIEMVLLLLPVDQQVKEAEGGGKVEDDGADPHEQAHQVPARR